MEVAARFKKPLIATSDAHRLHAFGSNYTSIPRPVALTIENVLAALRKGPLRLTNPACGFMDFVSTVYWVFVAHPLRRLSRRRDVAPRFLDVEIARRGKPSKSALSRISKRDRR
jgi:hypothetical protein